MRLRGDKERLSGAQPVDAADIAVRPEAAEVGLQFLEPVETGRGSLPCTAGVGVIHANRERGVHGVDREKLQPRIVLQVYHGAGSAVSRSQMSLRTATVTGTS